ncbi:unnamed protein product [Adineta ricciae]|uniref:Uncharacterized protein n=1 Tax=Adineta ricciae TaxID=249248 RepID=A0A814QUI8_ADIRI|nr:unnamed protein product [Adineta ricciae]CAF1288578.1 unnamed protein product [Adineta ricciae]
MSFNSNKIGVCATTSNNSKQDKALTIESRILSERNRKSKIIRLLLAIITSILLMGGITIPLLIIRKLKLDPSTLLPLTNLTTINNARRGRLAQPSTECIY